MLAAGASTRMGRPKALLIEPSRGATFVACVAGALLDGGASAVAIVGRPADTPLREAVARLTGPVRFVENPRPTEGQLSSVIAGLDAVEASDVSGVLVTPVDLPLIRPATVATLLAAFSSSGRTVVRAAFRGRHGHPVVLDRTLFDPLRRADPRLGARAVVRAADPLDVEVDDPGVVDDVDTPEDYERLGPR